MPANKLAVFPPTRTASLKGFYHPKKTARLICCTFPAERDIKVSQEGGEEEVWNVGAVSVILNGHQR